MTRSAPIAGIGSATYLSGINPKAQLLVLCARIGYTPHLNVQH